MPKLIRITTVPVSLEVLLTGQMRYMKERGFQVSSMSSGGIEKAMSNTTENFEHIAVPLTRSMTPIRDLYCVVRMFLHFWKQTPNIIHSHTPKAGLISMLAAKFAGVRIRIHTIAGFRADTMTGFKRMIMISMEKLTYWAATDVWPNSHSLMQYVLESGLVKPSKLKVIGNGSTNGIDLSEFSLGNLDPKKLGALKGRIDYDDSLKYLVFVGRIVSDKGIAELVEAFGKILHTHPEVRLLLVGNYEPELDPIDSFTQSQINSCPEIITTGYSKDVKYYLALADLLIFPSHREGFPNVPMQAGAMECPIICSQIRGNCDIVEDGATGVYHQVKNASDLETKIRYALENPAKMKAMAKQHRRVLLEKYSRPFVHQCLFEAYNQILEANENGSTV